MLKPLLTNLESVTFVLPNGSLVPPHFHVTEVGQTFKKFIEKSLKLKNIRAF